MQASSVCPPARDSISISKKCDDGRPMASYGEDCMQCEESLLSCRGDHPSPACKGVKAGDRWSPLRSSRNCAQTRRAPSAPAAFVRELLFLPPSVREVSPNGDERSFEQSKNSPSRLTPTAPSPRGLKKIADFTLAAKKTDRTEIRSVCFLHSILVKKTAVPAFLLLKGRRG